MGIESMPGVGSGPGYHYSETEEGAKHIEQHHNNERDELQKQKNDQLEKNRQAKFDGIEVGATITLKENGKHIHRTVSGKDPKTLKIFWTEKLGESAEFGGEVVNVDEIIDVHNPKKQEGQSGQ